jgi:Zn-dependent protease
LELVVIKVLVLVFSVVVHEVAHGWSALKLGDDTALRAGRLTLNPLPHLDPIGSIVVPVIMAATIGFPLGWAKPVPVHPGRLRNPDDDHPKVAAAGPASNFLLAFASAVLFGIALAAAGPSARIGHAEPTLWSFLVNLFFVGIFINVLLAVFNLIPVPPLDGSWILSRFLRGEVRARYEDLRRYGMMGFVFLIILLNYTPVGSFFRSLYAGIANKYLEMGFSIAGLFGS